MQLFNKSGCYKELLKVFSDNYNKKDILWMERQDHHSVGGQNIDDRHEEKPDFEINREGKREAL